MTKRMRARRARRRALLEARAKRRRKHAALMLMHEREWREGWRGNHRGYV